MWRSINDICTFYLEWSTTHKQTFSLWHINADSLLVNVILRCFDLWNTFRVSGEPEDLITGERQGHEDKQGLKEIGEWGTEEEVTGVYLKLICIFNTTQWSVVQLVLEFVCFLLFVYQLYNPANYVANTQVLLPSVPEVPVHPPVH